MQPIYEHEQTSPLIRISFCLLMACFATAAAAAWLSGEKATSVLLCVPVATFGLLLAMFHSLTVRAGANDIQLRFGIGLIRKSFLTHEIATTFATRTHWYNGWGIHMIRGGWLFNIAGFDAVEIVLTNGRRYQIGTDEPEQLLTAINTAIGKPRTSAIQRS